MTAKTFVVHHEKCTMSNAAIQKILCLKCHAVLDATDNYCRHCGEPTVIVAQSGNARPRTTGGGYDPASRPPSFVESPWVILPLIFLVLGPLALPLLWRSRQFSPLWKNIVTAITLAYTLLLLGSVWFSVQEALKSFGELDKLRAL